MINNDILRRLRYSFEYNDNKMISIFALADLKVSNDQIRGWLKKEEDPEFIAMSDSVLATFLNGLINEKRGKREGPAPTPEKRLTNNIILTKLKIALNLRAEDIIEMFSSVGFKLAKPELSAFARKTDHRHYRECKDQVMRNFLQAIQEKYRVSPAPKAKVEDFADREHQSANHSAKPRKPKTAKPNASKIYVNPNASKQEKSKSDRKTLKLKPEDIWKT